MLTKRAKAYGSSCLQTVSLTLAISLQFILRVCAATEDRKNQSKNPYFGSSGSFKVIDVDTTEKLITSACCNKQHAHAYLQPFSRKTGKQQQNNDFYGGTALWCPRTQVSLNLENRDLNRRHLRSMLKISYACSFSIAISIDFSAIRSSNLCRSPKIAKKSIKTPILAFKVIQCYWFRCQSRANVRLPISD